MSGHFARTDLIAATRVVPFVTARVRPLDERLWSIINKDGPLNADEAAYLAAAERSAS